MTKIVWRGAVVLIAGISVAACGRPNLKGDKDLEDLGMKGAFKAEQVLNSVGDDPNFGKTGCSTTDEISNQFDQKLSAGDVFKVSTEIKGQRLARTIIDRRQIISRPSTTGMVRFELEILEAANTTSPTTSISRGDVIRGECRPGQTSDQRFTCSRPYYDFAGGRVFQSRSGECETVSEKSGFEVTQVAAGWLDLADSGQGLQAWRESSVAEISIKCPDNPMQVYPGERRKTVIYGKDLPNHKLSATCHGRAFLSIRDYMYTGDEPVLVREVTEELLDYHR
jgi:hypothetical protein